MSKNLEFTKKAWEDYLYWQQQDKKTLKKINNLLEGLQRENTELIGKAEKLLGNLSGFSSLRINGKDRLVYKVIGDTTKIIQCKGHYDDK